MFVPNQCVVLYIITWNIINILLTENTDFVIISGLMLQTHLKIATIARQANGRGTNASRNEHYAQVYIYIYI